MRLRNLIRHWKGSTMKTNTLDFDAQALRERILDLAMRGKLVSQDPNDEPASVLLEKIKAEREELVKEKKIKKTKALPAITDDEKPFDIPDSWEWVRLGDITTFSLGKTPRRANNLYWNKGTIPWVSIGDLGEDKFITKTKEKITSEALNDVFKGNIVPSKTLLMSFKLSIGKVGILNIPAVHNEAIISINPIKNKKYITRDYLYYLLPVISNKSTFTPAIKGKTLNKTLLNNLMIPFPSLSEQKRIATKVSRLFALLRKIESSTQRYAELQTLLKSRVLDLAMRGKLVKQDPNDEPASELLEKIKAEKAELVKEKKIKKSKPLSPITDEEKPFDIPDSWEWVRLGDISNFMNGFAYKSKLYVKKSNNQVIRLGNVKNDQLIVDKKQVFIDDDYADVTNNYRIKKGDLLFTMTGTRNKRDYFFTLLVNEKDLNNRNLYLNQRVGCLNYIFGVNKLWLNYILKSQTILDEVFKNETGTVNQGNIGATKTMKILIPLPPLSEQNRIANRIEEITNLLFSLIVKSN